MKCREGKKSEVNLRASGSVDSSFNLTIFFLTVIVICLTPLVFDTGLFQTYALPKAVVFKAGLGILAVFWSISQLSSSNNGEGLWQRGAPFMLPLGLFTLVFCVTTFLSIDPWMSLVGVYGRFFGLQGMLSCFVSFLILVSTAQRKEDAFALLHLVYFTGAVVGFYALLQFLALDPINSSTFLFPGQKVYSSTGNANFCGNVLALILPLGLFLVMNVKKTWGRALIMTEILFVFTGIVCSQTRGAWIGTLCSMLAMIGLCHHFIWKKSRWERVKRVMGKLILFLVIFILSSWFVFNLFERPENFFYPLPFFRLVYVFWPGKDLLEKSRWRRIFLLMTLLSFLMVFPLFFLKSVSFFVGRIFSFFEFHQSIRMYLWQDFFAFIKDQFVWGSGPETYRRAFMPYKGLELAMASAEEHDNPHNNFLSQWAGMGIFAPIISLSIFYILFKENWRILRSFLPMPDKILAISFFCMGVSYFVWGLPAFDTVVNYPIFVSLLAAFSIWRRFLPLENGKAKTLAHSILRRIQILPLKKCQVAFLILVLPLGFLSSYTMIQHYKADVLFLESIVSVNRAQSLFRNHSVKGAEEQVFLAIDQINKAILYNPQESYYYFHLARLYFDLANKTKSEVAKRDAFLARQEWALQKASEHPWAPEAIWMERMNASILRNANDEAIANAEKVLENAPYQMDARRTMDKLHFNSKKWMQDHKLIPSIVENAELILKFDPKYIFSRLFLIDIYLVQRDFDKALEQVYFLKESDPNKQPQLKKIVEKIDWTRRESLRAGLRSFSGY